MSVKCAAKDVMNTMYENLDVLDISLDSPILDAIIELDRWLDVPTIWVSMTWVTMTDVVFNGAYFTEEEAVRTMPAGYEEFTCIGHAVLGHTYQESPENTSFYYPYHGKGY